MTSVLDATTERPSAAPGVRILDPKTWPPTWPLSVLVLGFPVWWALGISDMLPVVVAVPMARQLMRKRTVRTPPGFAIWLVFIACVVASGVLLRVDAPYAIPGGAASRPMVFVYRLAWYLAITVVVLWVANLDRSEMPTKRLYRLIGWLFVYTAFGGLLGVLAPNFQFSSLMEVALPAGIAKNGFIKPLIHPAAATVSTILGDATPRPTAPFAFSNSWGANISITLPFFIAGWMARDARWRRAIAPVILLVAIIPVVFSLNRGLWASLGLVLAFVLVRIALSGRPVVLFLSGVAVVLAAVVFVASPLSTLVSERINAPHSNERRGQLLDLTVQSTAEGSPILGFGSTRAVKGSFASIAGGATTECPACRVPPLGTQGQIWLVIFSQGFLGMAAFLAFYLRQGLEYWRCPTTAELVGMCGLLFFAAQLLVYDTLGMPMYVLMVGIGLMWRERLADDYRTERGSTVAQLKSTVSGHRRMLASFALVGGIIGFGMAWTKPPSFVANAPVLLAPSPVHLTTDIENTEGPEDITIDTEAAMVFSERAIETTREKLGLPEDEDIRSKISVTAPEKSRVLEIRVTDADRERAAQIADSLAESYLAVRGEYLQLRREQVTRGLEQQLGGVTEASPDQLAANLAAASGLPADELLRSVDSVLLSPTKAGDPLRPALTKRAGLVARDSDRLGCPDGTGRRAGAHLGDERAAPRPGWNPGWRTRVVEPPPTYVRPMSTTGANGTIDALVETVERLWPDAASVRVTSRNSIAVPTTTTRRELAVVPDAASARLLIPADRRGAARSMLRFSASLRPREVVQRIGVAAGLRVIGTRLLSDRIEILGGSGDDIESHLATVLGRPVTVSLGIGPARANRKPVLGVFDAHGRPVAFVKVGDSRVATGHVTGEADNLRTIATASLPHVIVPRILHEEDWHDMHLLVMSALPTRARTGGIDLRHPPVEVIDDLFTAFDEGRSSLAETPIWNQMLLAADDIRDEELRATYCAGLVRTLDELGGEVVPVGAWHGDFAPWNLSRVRDRVAVWDWERFTTGSPAGLDLAHWVVNIHTRDAGFESSIVRDCMAIAGGIGEPRHWLGRASSETYLASLSLRYLLAAQDDGGDVLTDRALAALRAFVDVASDARMKHGSTMTPHPHPPPHHHHHHHHHHREGVHSCRRCVVSPASPRIGSPTASPTAPVSWRPDGVG